MSIEKLIQACIQNIQNKVAAFMTRQEDQHASVMQAVLVSQYHLMKHSLPPTALPKLSQVGFKVYSQFEEDGLLLFIFSLIGAESRRVLEVCAGNGRECMAANLIINHGWEGLLFDGNEAAVAEAVNFFAGHPRTWLHPPQCIHAWITRDNINELVTGHGFSGEIDLLSLDMDGNDYWILKALNGVSPRVIICETQNAVPAGIAVTQPYAEDFRLTAEQMADGFLSASLAAMQKLCAEKGYRLIGGHGYGFNAIFMRDGVGENFFPEVSVESVLSNPYSLHTCQTKWPSAQKHPWVAV
ncbi:MAG: hypothetical protein LBO64_08230 [Desulfovibrio sp.]|jgi:hypothetical protein|nr:hypothetical protein [Desulfovibrio sp.]